MPVEKILIAVKTYPVLSDKYKELACTAGFNESGDWIRLYPIPFRFLKDDQRYKKYQWIEANIDKSKTDRRPESYRVNNTDAIRTLDTINTDREWEQRRRLVLSNRKIFTNLAEIIQGAHRNIMSLAVFKPTEILDFIVEDAEPEWPEHKIKNVLNEMKQQSFFDEHSVEDFKMMPKLPKKFSYRFKDDKGKRSTLMIEDWEIGQLWWNCRKAASSDEEAIEKVRQKYFADFAKTKDLYLFLGTTREWHIKKAPNPYVIVGTFHPPYQRQPSLL